MTQTALVKKVLNDGRIEISVQRKSACGHDCSECSGCELTIINSDLILTVQPYPGVRPGDMVLVESDSGHILGAAAAVYLVPIVLLFIGYMMGAALSFGEGVSIAMSAAGLAVGFIPARMLDRKVNRNRTIQFHIVDVLKPCSDM